MKKKLFSILLVIIFILGLSLLLYPKVSDYINSLHQSKAIASYTQAVASADDEQLDEMWENAQKYNSDLLENPNRFMMDSEQEDEYNDLLDINGDGIMAYISIPSINCTLPVYHGIDEENLQIAVGHIPGSSLPVGGKGTHCVLSGHRGLPSAKLFSDINVLKEGDVFMIYTLNRVLTYEVDQIRIVLPEEIDDIMIDEDEDYCTLVTCTPYGVNTHRLLVRGHRIDNIQGDAKVTADALQFDTNSVALAISIPVLIILLACLFIYYKKKSSSTTYYTYKKLKGENNENEKK